MTPKGMIRDLSVRNAGVRSQTGQGEPGLHTLLGGGEAESEYSGGSSSGAAYARLAASHKDKRLAGYLAAVAAGINARFGSGDNRGPSGPRDQVK